MEKAKYIINVVIVALLMASVAISRDGRLVGTSVKKKQVSSEQAPQSTVTTEDEVSVINSTTLASDIIGYAGPTPVEITVSNGIIEKVEPLENNETPSFFIDVVESGLFEKWQGMSLKEAATAEMDAVSGSTLSSKAVIKNVQITAAHASKQKIKKASLLEGIALKDIAGFIVILLGVAVVILRPKSKIIIMTQLALNVVVLGFWCGSFLSLSKLVAWASNGVGASMFSLALLLLVVTLVMPLLGKKGSYCYMHCPLGSAQELLGRIPTRKLKIKPKVNKFLNKLRYYILLALLFMMWLGVGFSLMDYELFSAFIISTASTGILIATGAFLILSLFIQRPYCRFVCPTGALLTSMQNTNK